MATVEAPLVYQQFATALENQFHPVARSEDVTAAPAAFALLEERMVLWRDAGGRPVAFRDVCIHRGTALSLGT